MPSPNVVGLVTIRSKASQLTKSKVVTYGWQVEEGRVSLWVKWC